MKPHPEKPPTHRAKWRDTGKLLCTYPTEEIAKALFPSADRAYHGELIIEPIPENEPRNYGYGRDEYE